MDKNKGKTKSVSAFDNKNENEVHLDTAISGIDNAIKNTKVNKKYQASFFETVFRNEDIQRSMCKILFPNEDFSDAKFINVELKNTFLMMPYNDVCFIVNNHIIILAEHQSTINPNMPLRFLIYLILEYYKYLKDRELWDKLLSKSLVKIPTPRMFLVYTGDDPIEDKLKLSNSFSDKDANNFQLEMTIPVFKKENATGPMGEFISFIKEVKQYKKSGMNLEDAISKVVEKWINNGSELSNVLKKESDIMMMIENTITQEKYADILRKEGREEGREEGIQNTIEALMDFGIDKNTAIEKAASKFNCSREYVEEVYAGKSFATV